MTVFRKKEDSAKISQQTHHTVTTVSGFFYFPLFPPQQQDSFSALKCKKGPFESTLLRTVNSTLQFCLFGLGTLERIYLR